MVNTHTELAIKFAEANKQEQKWLREEIAELQGLLAAIVTQYGSAEGLLVYSKHISLARRSSVISEDAGRLCGIFLKVSN